MVHFVDFCEGKRFFESEISSDFDRVFVFDIGGERQ